jgi:hypothetical protein
VVGNLERFASLAMISAKSSGFGTSGHALESRSDNCT